MKDVLKRPFSIGQGPDDDNHLRSKVAWGYAIIVGVLVLVVTADCVAKILSDWKLWIIGFCLFVTCALVLVFPNHCLINTPKRIVTFFRNWPILLRVVVVLTTLGAIGSQIKTISEVLELPGKSTKAAESAAKASEEQIERDRLHIVSTQVNHLRDAIEERRRALAQCRQELRATIRTINTSKSLTIGISKAVALLDKTMMDEGQLWLFQSDSNFASLTQARSLVEEAERITETLKKLQSDARNEVALLLANGYRHLSPEESRANLREQSNNYFDNICDKLSLGLCKKTSQSDTCASLTNELCRLASQCKCTAALYQPTPNQCDIAASEDPKKKGISGLQNEIRNCIASLQFANRKYDCGAAASTKVTLVNSELQRAYAVVSLAAQMHELAEPFPLDDIGQNVTAADYAAMGHLFADVGQFETARHYLRKSICQLKNGDSPDSKPGSCACERQDEINRAQIEERDRICLRIILIDSAIRYVTQTETKNDFEISKLSIIAMTEGLLGSNGLAQEDTQNKDLFTWRDARFKLILKVIDKMEIDTEADKCRMRAVVGLVFADQELSEALRPWGDEKCDNIPRSIQQCDRALYYVESTGGYCVTSSFNTGLTVIPDWRARTIANVKAIKAWMEAIQSLPADKKEIRNASLKILRWCQPKKLTDTGVLHRHAEVLQKVKAIIKFNTDVEPCVNELQKLESQFLRADF